MDQANTVEQILVKRNHVVVSVSYNQADNNVVGAEYRYHTRGSMGVVDMADTIAQPAIQQRFAEIIELDLAENKKMVENLRYSDEKIAVLNTAKKQFGLYQ